MYWTTNCQCLSSSVVAKCFMLHSLESISCVDTSKLNLPHVTYLLPSDQQIKILGVVSTKILIDGKLNGLSRRLRDCRLNILE